MDENLFEIKSSLISGAGLGAFTTVFIPKNTVIGYYTGMIYRRNKFDRKFKEGDNCYGFIVTVSGKDMVIDGSNGGNWTRFMNCAFSDESENVSEEKNEDKITFRAKRDIAAGEELYYFYGKRFAEWLGITWRNKQ